MSCAVHNKPASLTMEKSVQCDVVDVVNFAETEKENQMIQVHPPEIGTTNAPLTNGHIPFPAATQTASSIAMVELESQPLVKAVSEKHASLQNILGTRVKGDMNLDILEFDTLKENRLNFSLNPFVSKPASLVTVVKFEQGEFVEVKSPSSYNSSMSLWDMKSAIAAALDSSIIQSGVEVPVSVSPPRSGPRQDVAMNDGAENSSQEKNTSPKKSPPSKVVEGSTATNSNVSGTSGDSKVKPASPKGNAGSKGTHTGPKGTSGETKSTTNGAKTTEKRQRKTTEKVKEKNSDVPKEKAEPAKVEAAPAKPTQAKPAQTRVKKVKIPDEESIKFANRQREIQRLKKELKEKLKREGKDGVDPAARINAWGRTVGVTCTMCGNHVQKSYGCFRRDTAPEKLIHLFTPGMNRIKICRRCLPYKKQAGKAETDNRVLKPGLLSLPNDPRELNPGTNTPITIAPLPEKPVSATTLNAIHRKVTGQENNEHDNTAHVNIASHVNIGTGHMNSLPGHVNNGSSHINNVAGIIHNKSGHMNTGSIHVSTGALHVNPNSDQVIDATEIDLSGESSRGSAIDYIRKLALNLKTNYNPQPGENNMAGKTDITTPEEQIIKTPIFEQMSNFTPVTPSMNLGQQITNPVSVVGNVNPVQWKPVLNQVTPVTQPITPETTAGFVQVTEGNAIPTPPWSTVPLVLKTQPNIVFTSPGQVTRDPLSTPLQTFVTTANQKDVKLLPAIMVPSQNALPGQGPVLLQIQRVKLVRDTPPGEGQDNKNKTTEGQGKQNEMFVQPATGISVPTYGGYVGSVVESTAGHQTLPVEISSAGPETSISNFLSQTNEISPAQMEPSTSNFQALTDEITTPQLEASTVDLQSIAGEISSSQVETSTGDIQKITEELASLIERTSEYRQDKDVNLVGMTGHLGAQQDVGHIEQEQSGKPSEDINVVDSKILESGYLQPNEALGEQILTAEGIGVSYSQHEPAVVLCGSVDITSQSATMYPSGYQVTNGGQDGILEASTNSCVQNVFESQISEEYLPQTNVENLKEMSKSEQEVVMESIEDSGLLAQNDKVEEKKMPDVKDDLPEVPTSQNDNVGSDVQSVQDKGNKEKNLEAIYEGISVVTKEDDEKLEERRENVQEEGEMLKKEQETLEKDGSQKEDETDSNIAAKLAVDVAEEEEQGKGITAKEITSQQKSVTSSLTADEKVTLDLRRSQRRAASPRKSPSRKVETKVHGTRQQRQKTEQQGTQKEKVGQHGTLRDKTGQLGTRRGKTEQQGTLKDKAGQSATQRGKADRQGSQKDENEPETTPGVKRKRQGRGTKPVKFQKQ